MKVLVYTVASICIAMVLFAMVTRAQDTTGAIVSVKVEDDNDTSIEVIVDAREPVQSQESFIDPNAEPFIPTKEWQHVKPGQSVPSGLHIRLNLETGEREAKLMDGDDGSRFEMKEQFNMIDGTDSSRLKQLKKTFEDAMKDVDTSKTDDSSIPGKQGMFNIKKDSFSRAELKEALKKFRASDDDVKTKQDQKKFRSADELKQHLKDLNLEVKTDQEIMGGLLKRYKTQLSAEERETILEDLELLVHQIDNAHYLVDSGGLQHIVNDLNHTNPLIGLSAAFVIGSAVQSNPQVQVAVLKAGVLPQLIQKLSASRDTNILHKYLYALSTLVRQYPYAQQKLVESGGLQTLATLLATADDVKIKVKVVTLMTDILLERKYAADQYLQEQSEVFKEKLWQYEKVDIIRQIQEKDWCAMVTSLLALKEHDSREKVLLAMDTLIGDCVDSFANSLLQLNLLKKEYSSRAIQEASENDSDTYFADLLTKIESILQKIEEYNKYMRHIDL